MADVIDIDEKVMEQSQAGRKRDEAEDEEWGVHPVGALVGAASGAGAATLAGAALAGPAGAVAGAIFGAVAGGLAGDEVAEAVNPKTVEKYWEKHYPMRPYAKSENGYDYYKDAYNFGYEQRVKNPNKKFAETEEELRNRWNASQAANKSKWDDVREAARDSFETAEEAYYDKETDSFVVRPRKNA